MFAAATGASGIWAVRAMLRRDVLARGRQLFCGMGVTCLATGALAAHTVVQCLPTVTLPCTCARETVPLTPKDVADLFAALPPLAADAYPNNAEELEALLFGEGWGCTSGGLT